MQFYKVISLFIKIILLVASFCYIIHKLNTSAFLLNAGSIHFSSKFGLFLSLTVLLMFCNWSLEARKWQILISSCEKITWPQALQAVFTGVAVSLFTPNRVGEFAGRIFFLKKTDRITASMKSFFGSFVQLMITLVAGGIGIVLYTQRNGYQQIPLQSFLDPQKKWHLTFFALLFLALITGVLRSSYFKKWKQQSISFLKIPTKEFFSILFFSAMRYLVFTVQFYFILLALGMEIEFISAFMLIAVTFLITTLIPTFALTEIVVRSAVSVSVFAAIDSSSPEVAAAAFFLLWMINLAIPAFIGSLFIGKLQFFKA